MTSKLTQPEFLLPTEEIGFSESLLFANNSAYYKGEKVAFIYRLWEDKIQIIMKDDRDQLITTSVPSEAIAWLMDKVKLRETPDVDHVAILGEE